MTAQQQLQKWIDESERIVFFGGAGVSTESGVKDFRSVDGLYSEKFDYPPETILSHSFFMEKPEEFYRFYKEKMICPPEVQPNAAHRKLAQMERAGKLRAVITQNIDGLHKMAGSRMLYELHGTTAINRCMKCTRCFDTDYVMAREGVPRCEYCGGMLKPEVVLYEEPLDEEVMEGAVMEISRADMLIVGGTSLVVYPAAGLINYYRGNKLVLINRDPTPYDRKADLVIHDSIGKVLDAVRI